MTVQTRRTLGDQLRDHPMAFKPWARVTVTDWNGHLVFSTVYKGETENAVNLQIERARANYMLPQYERYFFINRPADPVEEPGDRPGQVRYKRGLLTAAERAETPC